MPDLRHEPMAPHFDKWHLGGLPRAAVLHRFSDPDHGAPHDHPFPFTSFVIAGGYVEQVFALDGSSELVHRKPGDAFHIAATHIHRIVELPEGECWTLILPGPHEQTPGFFQWRDGIAFHRFWNEAEFRPCDGASPPLKE